MELYQQCANHHVIKVRVASCRNEAEVLVDRGGDSAPGTYTEPAKASGGWSRTLEGGAWRASAKDRELLASNGVTTPRRQTPCTAQRVAMCNTNCKRLRHVMHVIRKATGWKNALISRSLINQRACV
jgi:hypothetical protein